MKRYFYIKASNGQKSLLKVECEVSRLCHLTDEAIRQGVIPPNARVKLHREISRVEYYFIQKAREEGAKI